MKQRTELRDVGIVLGNATRGGGGRRKRKRERLTYSLVTNPPVNLLSIIK